MVQWFPGFPDSSRFVPEADWQETPVLMAELEGRLAEFTANPAIAVPFEPDYFENLKRELADERAQKASPR
ncbi:MAG: hypothetical protein M5U12_34020 [Verrucomicrobia bacterium]|nr:hypothetical protein [Verrucomicrobiota bacterium]